MIKLIDIINESKQVGTLYHFTRIRNLLPILKSGVLKPSGAREEKNSFISFSRDKALGATLGSDRTKVRIQVNGDKLSTKYKIFPYAQTKPETDYDEENWVEPFSRNTQSSESEQVVPSRKYGGSINILPYIEKIDIILSKNLDFWDKDEINKIKKLSKKLNIYIEFYDENRDIDFFSQGSSHWSSSKNKIQK
jgi:hypothetical protein